MANSWCCRVELPYSKRVSLLHSRGDSREVKIVAELLDVLWLSLRTARQSPCEHAMTKSIWRSMEASFCAALRDSSHPTPRPMALPREAVSQLGGGICEGKSPRRCLSCLSSRSMSSDQGGAVAAAALSSEASCMGSSAEEEPGDSTQWRSTWSPRKVATRISTRLPSRKSGNRANSSCADLWRPRPPHISSQMPQPTCQVLCLANQLGSAQVEERGRLPEVDHHH